MTSPHPFTSRPHRTLLGLSIPVLISLTAEPITALVDTAFISSLGVIPLAALGVGTTALSSLFWMFNFLGIGTQTEVAQIYGRGEEEGAGKILSLALILAAAFGILLILLFGPTSNWLAGLLGAAGEVQINAVKYMQIRLFGAPAVLITLVTFGALRGLQDMRTPLWIALGVNQWPLPCNECGRIGPGKHHQPVVRCPGWDLPGIQEIELNTFFCFSRCG